MDFTLKTMNVTLYNDGLYTKTMDYKLKTMEFILKAMEFMLQMYCNHEQEYNFTPKDSFHSHIEEIKTTILPVEFAGEAGDVSDFLYYPSTFTPILLNFPGK